MSKFTLQYEEHYSFSPDLSFSSKSQIHFPVLKRQPNQLMAPRNSLAVGKVGKPLQFRSKEGATPHQKERPDHKRSRLPMGALNSFLPY
ncbi:testis-specific 13 protein isoform B [Alligator mississippiensis]|uniref:Testis-specific 13 protein isoform B n=1 Tax=Alligator mississippiensis TaxID=8496 RepID=A0A151NPY4_ALLMI|nr:testis-specific 13 protein isoform B [Alligator mississippiensis]